MAFGGCMTLNPAQWARSRSATKGVKTRRTSASLWVLALPRYPAMPSMTMSR
jgi:hypothetical protein